MLKKEKKQLPKILLEWSFQIPLTGKKRVLAKDRWSSESKFWNAIHFGHINFQFLGLSKNTMHKNNINKVTISRTSVPWLQLLHPSLWYQPSTKCLHHFQSIQNKVLPISLSMRLETKENSQNISITHNCMSA